MSEENPTEAKVRKVAIESGNAILDMFVAMGEREGGPAKEMADAASVRVKEAIADPTVNLSRLVGFVIDSAFGVGITIGVLAPGAALGLLATMAGAVEETK